jgi:hypothetical protein
MRGNIDQRGCHYQQDPPMYHETFADLRQHCNTILGPNQYQMS